MKFLKRFSSALIAAVVLGSVFPASIASAGGSGCWHHKHKERRFARMINDARSGRGEHRLDLDRHLSRVARKHTRGMARRQDLGHTPSRKLRRRVTRWTMLGENVGVGNTVRSLHRAFMNSPGHKANVLYRSFRHVGVGTKQKHGRLWVTVIFESARNPGTRLRMPSC